MTAKYKARRFAVGKGVPVGKHHIKGRDRLAYMGPKGGLYCIGTNSVTTSRKKRLVVRYFRIYLQQDKETQEPVSGDTLGSTPPQANHMKLDRTTNKKYHSDTL